MFSVVVHKDRWLVGADVIYMDLEQDFSGSRGPISIRGDVELAGWIVTPAVGYNLHEGERGRFDLLAGAPYLYLGVDADATFSAPILGSTSVSTSESGSE